jgi:hypothetical protein
MKGTIRNALALLGLAVSGVLAQAQTPGAGPSCPGGNCGGGVEATCPTGLCGGPAGHGGKKNCSPTVLERTGYNNQNLYDRCWFTRYSNLSHRAVNRALTPQVQNGHVLDQTMWNHMFEPGTDVLNGLGLSHLQYLSRRRPEADRTVYLATAMDLQYDPAAPERYAGARQELDTLRVAAIHKYLVAVNAGRCSDFQVLVHDPADPTISAVPASLAVTQMYGRFRGGLGGGGSAGPSGSVGGFAGAGGAAGR